MKILLEYGPIIAFFVAYKLYGLMPATAVIVVATLVALAITYIREKRVPALPLATAIIVSIFGGLTLLIGDEVFIKMKPTIINVLLGGALLVGLLFRKALLKPVMGHAVQMTEAGWHTLSLRYGLFFLCLAGLNEWVWRTQTTDIWVDFKLFGMLGLTFVFILSQLPLMKHHMIEDEEQEPSEQSSGD